MSGLLLGALGLVFLLVGYVAGAAVGHDRGYAQGKAVGHLEVENLKHMNNELRGSLTAALVGSRTMGRA